MLSMYLNPVTNLEMPNILQSLKRSATGWGKIPLKLLKLSISYMVQPLIFRSSLSLTQGYFHIKWTSIYECQDYVYVKWECLKYYVKHKAPFETWKHGKRKYNIIILWGIDIYVRHNRKQWKSCSPLCQTYIPTLISNSISKKWNNIQEASGNQFRDA